MLKSVGILFACAHTLDCGEGLARKLEAKVCGGLIKKCQARIVTSSIMLNLTKYVIEHITVYKTRKLVASKHLKIFDAMVFFF